MTNLLLMVLVIGAVGIALAVDVGFLLTWMMRRWKS